MRTSSLVVVCTVVLFGPSLLGFGPETSVFHRIGSVAAITLVGILYEFEEFRSSMEDFIESSKGSTE